MTSQQFTEKERRAASVYAILEFRFASFTGICLQLDLKTIFPISRSRWTEILAPIDWYIDIRCLLIVQRFWWLRPFHTKHCGLRQNWAVRLLYAFSDTNFNIYIIFLD